jgi:serine/threonine protein kinase
MAKDASPVDPGIGESIDGWSDTLQVICQLRLLADVAAADQAENPAPPSIPAPSTWGPLEIIRELGRGGYGVVYLAWESKLERTVALKILHYVDRSSAAVQEGRMLALAEHPNVVRVMGADEHDGLVGLWMEFIKGVTLKEFLERNGALGAQEAGNIGICLCQAVAAVHQAGLLHRDIKVHNVMREDRTGRIVLMDLGSGAVRTDDPRDMPDLVGTPLYIAPELLNGAPATIASDVYSLGVVLYHLVTLAYPVAGETLEGAQEAHGSRRFVPLSDRRPDLPATFVCVVSRALARDPAMRYESVGAMQEELIRAMGLDVLARQGRPGPRRDGPPWLVVPPFLSIGDEQHIQYFRDHLAQERITGLVKNRRGLRVSSRESPMRALAFRS